MAAAGGGRHPVPGMRQQDGDLSLGAGIGNRFIQFCIPARVSLSLTHSPPPLLLLVSSRSATIAGEDPAATE